MRRILVIAAAVLVASGCRSLAPAVDAPPELQQFLSDFAGQVEDHHWNEVAACFDPDFLAHRRDVQLRGRSGLFLLQELGIAGRCAKGRDDELDAYACLDRICRAEVLSFTPDQSHEEIAGRVSVEIEPDCTSSPVTVTLELRRVVGGVPHDWGLVGAGGDGSRTSGE